MSDKKLHLTPTEQRIVKLLLVEPQLSYQLEKKAFCRYAADHIKLIRRKGLKIVTDMVVYKRKTDGKTTRVGRYRIDNDSIDAVRRFISIEE